MVKCPTFSAKRASVVAGLLVKAVSAINSPSFWNSSLFGESDYRGHPFLPHASMPIDGTHFNRWLSILRMTIEEKFTGHKAEEIKWRAEKMAEMFQIKLKHVREHNIKPII